MSKFSTRGSKVYIEDGDVSRLEDPITSATAEKPVVVTPTTIANFADGDVVIMSGTGMPSVENRAFIVANIDVATFELCGSDGRNDVEATAGSATPRKFASDMVLACCNTFSINPDTPPTIDATTFCNVEQFIGETLPGNIALGGFIDACDPGYQQIVQAGDDGNERVVVIEFPKGKGWVVCVAFMSPVTQTYDLNAAAAFTGGGALRTPTTLCGVCT